MIKWHYCVKKLMQELLNYSNQGICFFDNIIQYLRGFICSDLAVTTKSSIYCNGFLQTIKIGSSSQ